MTASAKTTTRRAFLTSTAAAASSLACPALANRADEPLSATPVMLGFRAHHWQDYFETLEHGAILVDTAARALHYWSEDTQTQIIYPTSVPLTEDLTRLGRTKVTKKVVGPTWRPTPSMKERNPEWPDVIGPGPDNPLGSHALYLSWRYYRIHGTHDTRKIGRKSSNGCIGLYNEDISVLFDLAEVGTQVLLV